MVWINGQGLAGTWLSFFLFQKQIPFRVIDDGAPLSSSRIASGVMNPVTGRRMVETWMADTLFPFAENAYGQMGKLLETKLINPIPIYDFFSSPDRKLVFDERYRQNDRRLSVPGDQSLVREFFHAPFGYGCIEGAFHVHLSEMLEKWRIFLRDKNMLVAKKMDEKWQEELLQNGDTVIGCQGSHMAFHPAFDRLPFSLTKGECLIIEAKDLPPNGIYKKQLSLVPWKNGQWWAGSNYLHEFEDAEPEAKFYSETEAWLKSFLKIPFTILHHWAAIRPTTVDRRPFAGFHPTIPNLGILGGLGTKGVSLAPWMASQLAENIAHRRPLSPEIDIARYQKILQKKG